MVEQLAHDEPHLVLLVILIGRSSGTCRLSRTWWRRCCRCRRFFRPMNRRKRRARESGRALWASRGVVPTPVEVGLNRGGRNLIASRDDRLRSRLTVLFRTRNCFGVASLRCLRAARGWSFALVLLLLLPPPHLLGAAVAAASLDFLCFCP